VSEVDWDRLQHYSQKVKFFKAIDTNVNDIQVHPSTYFRIAQLQSSALFPSLRHLHYNLKNTSISDSHIFFFQSPVLDSLEFINIEGFETTIVGPFLATISSQILSRIILRSGQLTTDILKNSFVHFKQLRSLELSDAVFMTDFSLWEDIGTLPSLETLTLVADPASHPTRAPENSKSQSGDPSYFNALENLSVTGSFFLIQHLLGFIDSPYLNSIKVYPIINRPDLDEDPFTPSMTIIASKWSQSLKDLTIGTRRISSRSPISKCLMLLTDFHEMEKFRLFGWRMENKDDDVIRLAESWPKLQTLSLNRTFVSLSTLRIIAENCPELGYLGIPLNVSIIPPFDDSTPRLNHDLDSLSVVKVQLSGSSPITLKLQIKVTRHLDLIFPYLESIKVEDENWLQIRDLYNLCQDVRESES
jgi:hypothetical protein